MVTLGVATQFVGECCCILVSILFTVAILTTTGTTSTSTIQDNTTGMTILIPLPSVGDPRLVVHITGVLVAGTICITTTTRRKFLGKVIHKGLHGCHLVTLLRHE